MEIISISIGGTQLNLGNRKNNTTSWYELFMEYCIQKKRGTILSGGYLSERFSLNPEDPAFGKAVKWNRVRTLDGVYYHNYIDNRGKHTIIEKIGNELGLDLHIVVNENEQ